MFVIYEQQNLWLQVIHNKPLIAKIFLNIYLFLILNTLKIHFQNDPDKSDLVLLW